MRYTAWVERRSRLWDELEARLGAARVRRNELSHDDLEQLAFQYRQVLHDHAALSSRFRGSGAATRVHRLVIQATAMLRREEARQDRGLGYFLSVAFPRAFHAHLQELALAVGLFLLLALAGFATASVRPEVGSRILGPLAIEGLRDGTLWTERLVTTVPASISSSWIATNNLGVALTAWVGGAIGGLGSLWIVLFNGLHFGSILGVCLQYHMAGELLEFVVAHGLLEITLILVCAAAGLGVGRSMVVAGDWDRRDTVPAAAKRSLVLVAGCLPWFVLLAGVESLVSPRADIPIVVKILVGVSLEIAFLAVALRRAPEEIQ
jgi:uncharacterized membrane protein SpoIIM required for sporulation